MRILAVVLAIGEFQIHRNSLECGSKTLELLHRVQSFELDLRYDHTGKAWVTCVFKREGFLHAWRYVSFCELISTR